jgi:hypothetical protein
LDLGVDDLSYAEAQDEGVTDLPGCVKLWRAVIRQAAADATGAAPSRERAAARAWLTKSSADVDFALSNAGLDPMLVRAWANELAARNWRPLLRG